MALGMAFGRRSGCHDDVVVGWKGSCVTATSELLRLTSDEVTVAASPPTWSGGGDDDAAAKSIGGNNNRAVVVRSFLFCECVCV